MKNQTKKSILASVLIPMALMLSSCGDDSNQATSSSSGSSGGSSGSSDESGTASIALSYKNARNSNALIAISNGATFPSGSITEANKVNLGYFFQSGFGNCIGASIPLNFTLKNNGTSSVSASSSPAVTMTDNTSYTPSYPGMNSNEITYSLTTAPSFPLAAGASTDFTVTVNNSNNNTCLFGQLDATAEYQTIQKFRMIVHTNDSTNPSYTVDFTLYGNS